MSYYPESRTDQQGNVMSLEQLTTEQLRKIASDYKLSQEGDNPTLIARIKEYEFSQGKTIQPHQQKAPQQPVKGVNPQTGESLPGKNENDAEYAKNHSNPVKVADPIDDRNDRMFRNPRSEGMGTGPEADKLRKERVKNEGK